MRSSTAPSPEVLPEWLTVREAARRKGVSVTTIRNWVKSGRVGIIGNREQGDIRQVWWPDVERIEPAYGPGLARRT